MPFSLKDLEAVDDLESLYAAAIQTGPVAYSEPDGAYLVMSHAAVKAVISDYELYDPRQGSLQTRDVQDVAQDSLYFDPIFLQSPPSHTRVRRLAAHGYSIAAVSRLIQAAEDTAVELADTLSAAPTSVDLMSRFAEPMAIRLILEFLAVPKDARPALHELLQKLVRREEGTPEAADAHAGALAVKIAEHLGRARTQELGGFTGAVLNAKREDDGFSDGEAFGMLLLATIGGAEDMIRGLLNIVYALWRFPLQKAALLEDLDGLADKAIQEALRLYPTTQYLRRVTRRPVRLHGVDIPEGAAVIGLLAAANRDQGVFENPDAFVLGRRNTAASLTFGSGPHVCIGKHVARIILSAGLRALLRRWPKLELDLSRAERAFNPPILGFSRLPARLAASSARPERAGSAARLSIPQLD